MKELTVSLCSTPWPYIVSWLLTAVTFYWKLGSDLKCARYRETVAYIEKREESMRSRWKKIVDPTLDVKDRADDVFAFFAQMELISLLVENKAFDADIVYNFWWRYFNEPLKSLEINTWLLLEQESDKQIFKHYLALCRKWSPKIYLEQGLIKKPDFT